MMHIHRKHLASAILLALLTQASFAQSSASASSQSNAARAQELQAQAARRQSTDVGARDAAITPSATIPLTYVGSNARVGVSVNDDGDLSGEVLGVMRYTGTSAILGEGWLGQGGAGGLMFGYNWLWGAVGPQDAIERPENFVVAKAFVAVDRNSDRDRKLTIGVGAEKQDIFGSLYLSKAQTDERFTGQRRVSVTDVVNGTQAGRPFRQDRVTTTIFDAFEQAFDYSSGFRLGRYFDKQLIRVRGGLDYGHGDFDSSQLTVSAGIDKLFSNTGHSLSLDVSALNIDGDFAQDDNDTRAALTYRYNFGQSYRPAAWEYDRANPQVEPAAAKAIETKQVAVQNEAKLDSDAFFDFDKSLVRDETRAELDRLIGIITSSKLASAVSVVGHTCSIGTDAYNEGLSMRRAKAVADYLSANGVTAELVVDGKGESEPQFPNDTRENRKKNRRVDINFITIEEKMETQEVPQEGGAVTYKKSQIDVPPGWIERALRNPAEHRREVDTYRFETSRQETTLGPVVFINRSPVAVNDVISVRRNVGTLIPVLSNDSDPDGDTLSVTSVTQPANGAVSNSGNGVVYTPRTGFLGQDSFTYTVSDGQGGTATATVNITVADLAPIAADDSATVAGGASVTVAVLANDRDPEGGVLRVTAVAAPSRGTARIEGSNVVYTAPTDFTGPVSFRYTITDDAGNTASANINITVTAAPVMNRMPVANFDIARTVLTDPVVIDVLANDTDPDNDRLTIVSVTQGARGTVTIENGRIRYVAVAGYVGPDQFTYTISDGRGGMATAIVYIDVRDC
jgi:outer membrane protein OmpA-like peptidoglycan-associated protein